MQLQLSCTCKDLRGFTEQLWELRGWSDAVGGAVAMGRLPCLARIRVSHKRMGPEAMALLAQGCSRHHSLRGLTSLSLCNTGLGVHGAKVTQGSQSASQPAMEANHSWQAGRQEKG